MKRQIRLLPILAALALAAPAAAADLKTAIQQAPIRQSLGDAVHAPGRVPEPVLFRYMTSEKGYRLYQMEGLSTGKREYVLVPANAPVRRAAAEAAYNVAGGSTRCVVELFDSTGYGNLIVTTDLDWNNFSYISNVNDRTESVQTDCAGVWLYEDRNYDVFGLFLYVPANTSLTNLTASSMANKISSIQHDLP